MTKEELSAYKRSLDLWWAEKKEEWEELAAFRQFGGRQMQPSLRWEPNRPQVEQNKLEWRRSLEGFAARALATANDVQVKMSTTSDTYDKLVKFYGNRILGGFGDEVQVPRRMKCPTCGTNPGRCKEALTDAEKTCFRCGLELVSL